MGSDDPVAVLFGLSMDDEVFLLSRVREEYLHRGDNDAAVVEGISATARVIRSAALIMISVFGAFVLAGGAGLPEPECEAVAVLGTDPAPACESA